jgi:hypothetical protein
LVRLANVCGSPAAAHDRTCSRRVQPLRPRQCQTAVPVVRSVSSAQSRKSLNISGSRVVSRDACRALPRCHRRADAGLPWTCHTVDKSKRQRVLGENPSRTPRLRKSKPLQFSARDLHFLKVSLPFRRSRAPARPTFELTGGRQTAKPAVGRPVERGVRRRSSSRVTELHCPCGGCQSSTLLPSGSMTHPNFPYSESSVFSSTLQTSSRSTLRSAARSSTR